MTTKELRRKKLARLSTLQKQIAGVTCDMSVYGRTKYVEFKKEFAEVAKMKLSEFQ